MATAINGWSGISLTLTLLVAIFFSLTVRNFIALLTIWGALTSVALIWWFLPANAITLFIYTLGCFLIFSGVKNIIELQQITIPIFMVLLPLNGLHWQNPTKPNSVGVDLQGFTSVTASLL